MSLRGPADSASIRPMDGWQVGKKKERVCVGKRHARSRYSGRIRPPYDRRIKLKAHCGPLGIHISVHPPQPWRCLLEMARILAILICVFLNGHTVVWNTNFRMNYVEPLICLQL
jgi:hypothetical protein